MGKPMTKSQIIAAVAEKADISKAQAKDALEGLCELAYAGASTVSQSRNRQAC